MPNSLRTMIKKLRYKGKIDGAECEALLQKLKNHDEKLTEKAYNKGFRDAIDKALDEAINYYTEDGIFKAVQVETLEGLGMVVSSRGNGKWLIEDGLRKIYKCSKCGQIVMTDDIDVYRFCHNCGSEMGVQDADSN